eukprot:TRINITY_DN15956_c0_g1_i1.p1 TRINITY_DN15956_c0_g1~~TRINITY_DN15956_c0_g1_i1.p1  ORF type:complete len:670 (-),score=120.48 TRINITY_DN15956_c0_g1_i1:280-2085(-)
MQALLRLDGGKEAWQWLEETPEALTKKLAHIGRTKGPEMAVAALLENHTATAPDAATKPGWRRGAAVERNVIHYNTTIGACEKAGDWKLALWLLEVMVANSVRRDVISYNSAISACAKASRWEASLTVFEEILRTSDRRDLGRASPSPTLGVATSVASATASSIRSSGRGDGLRPDAVTCNALLSAFSRGREWQRAVNFLMGASGGTVAYNTTISACDRGGPWAVALALLADMEARSVPRDVVTYNALISVCSHGERWEVALRLLSSMGGTVSPNAISYTTAVDACVKQAHWATAVALFHEAGDRAVQGYVNLYNATISAMANGCQGDDALALFSSMPGKHLRADALTFTAVSSACEKAHFWERSLTLLDDMRVGRLRWDPFICSSTISACERARQWEAAVAVFDRAGAVGVEQTAAMHNSVLEAVFELPVGLAIFRRAIWGGVYSGLLSEGDACLDLHCLSAGAARLTLRWWLVEVVPRVLSTVADNTRETSARPSVAMTSSKSGRVVCQVIIGRGKSRRSWDVGEEVRFAVMSVMEELRVPLSTCAWTKGRLHLNGREARLASLAALASTPTAQTSTFDPKVGRALAQQPAAPVAGSPT